MNRIEYKNLVKFCNNLLAKAGLDQYSLDAVVTGLCETSLRGVDSHGIRLLPHYVNSAVTGRKNPKPNFKFEVTFPSIGHLDADDAFGHAAGMKAIDYAIDIAKTQGIGIVAVSNSSHPGAMASMALKAARLGYLSFAFTHADALIQSFNGKRAYFGTNPICFAAPRVEEEPYCLDMATSIIPWNRVKIHRDSGEPLSAGLAVDNQGYPTNDADKATALLPTGAYKGYGLASMIDILCGVYTGMAFGRSIPSMYGAKMTEQRKLGQFYMVFRADGVVDEKNFIDAMQQMTNEVREEPSFSGEPVILPGDKEIAESKYRMANGVPLDEATISSFKELGRKFDEPLQLIA